MTLTIDCQTCPARGHYCGDCFVPVLARTWAHRDGGEPGTSRRCAETLSLDAAEGAAVRTLLRAGLVSETEAGQATARAEPFLPRLHAAG